MANSITRRVVVGRVGRMLESWVQVRVAPLGCYEPSYLGMGPVKTNQAQRYGCAVRLLACEPGALEVEVPGALAGHRQH